MPSYNHIALIGRLTSNPMLEKRVAGKEERLYLNLTLSVKRKTGGTKERKKVDIFPFTLWGQKAQSGSNILRKGMLLLVEGTITLNRNEMGSFSSSHVIPEVVASNFTILEGTKMATPEKKIISDVEAMS